METFSPIATEDPDRPVRSRASSDPILSSSDSHSSPDEAQSSLQSSEEQSPTRGRTLDRVPAQDRSTSRAPSRRRMTAEIHPNVDSAATAQRLRSRDFSITPEEYDDSILEPRPFERCPTSLSEQLHRTSTYESTLEMHFRDTFAVMGYRRLKAMGRELSESFFDRLILYLDHQSYLNLRLSCRKFSTAITRTRPIVLSPVFKLPAEIIYKVHCTLNAVDFNAARHTCQAWMIASLDEKLLKSKLELEGWLLASRMDGALQETLQGPRRLPIISNEWLLSKRLATECSLRPGWTGNGLGKENQYTDPRVQPSRPSSLLVISETSFSGLSRDHDPGSLSRFTVSACGDFLLVVNGCNIYIYQLKPDFESASHPYGGHIQPFLITKCPQRILAVSMDTSSGRFAVAALLENRTGLVCESHTTDASGIWRATSTADQGMHLKTGPQTSYRNICSFSDPPRSVAICPHRRCVAFGSSTGVELHWRDVLTGQDMTRWFSLSSPSDFLYFMPEVQGTDGNVASAKKLRLLSSAAPPPSENRKDPNFLARPDRNDRDGGGAAPPAVDTRHVTEYFRALPMSDGSVLYTDPTSGVLCLAREVQSQQGRFHRTRLVQRFIFEVSSPSVYAAGKDLRWGVRIVAGFEGRIVLFTVPPDVYHDDSKYDDPQEIPSDIPVGPAPEVIRGAEIGSLNNLVDLAVDSSDGDLTVWAFTTDVTAYVWQLAGGRETSIVKRRVYANGTITTSDDVDSDIVMEDVYSSDGHFDDTRSVHHSPESLPHEDIQIFDEEGDTVMGGMEEEDEGYVSDDGYEQAGGPFAIHAPPLWGRWSEDDADWVPQYLAEKGQGIEDEGVGIDVLEMCRLECEILVG